MVQEYDPEDSPYSFGTTPIYNTLFKLLTPKDNTTDVVVINVSAIARNVSGKVNLQQEYKEARDKSFPFDTLANDIAKETVKEVKLLVSDIVQMINEATSPLPKYLYLYFADYSKVIPDAYYRKPATSKLHVDMAESILRKTYKAGRTQSLMNGVHVIELYNYGRLSPFRILEREIRSIRNQHNVVMVSNHPLDYHICHYVGDWKDIKSYTGAIQTKNVLGEKVLGYPYLPFTEKLHVLLGDKTDMKPVLTGKDKDRLLKTAEQDSWYLKSTEYVDRHIAALNLVLPYTI